jgi:hypothetical protein
LTTSALNTYPERRAARAADHARLARLDASISHARLAVVAAFALTAWLVLGFGASPWLFAVPVAAFIALAVWHDRVLRALDRAARAVTFYEHGMARLEDRWQDIGETGARFLSEEHLYTPDLDIFGPASLFQLLSRARTHLGEELLARWLSAPADVPTIGRRQESIVELREALDFREALATAGGASRDINTTALSAWASAPAAPESIWLRMAAVVLAAGIIGGVVWWVRGGPLTPLLVAIMLKMILTRPSRTRVARIVRGVEGPLRQLDVLADTLALLETSSLRSPRLAEIRAEMMSHGIAASSGWPTCSTGGATRCSRRWPSRCRGRCTLRRRSRAGGASSGRRSTPGWPRWRSTRRSAHWRRMRTNIRTTRFRGSSRMEGRRDSKAQASDIRSSRRCAWYATTSS